MQVQIESSRVSGVCCTSEQPYPGLEMTDGLLVGEAGRRLLAGLQPVSYCGFGHSCRRRVMRKKLGRRPDDFQGFDQFRVDGVAAVLQQILVGGITQECVLEDVGRIWRGAAAEDQFRIGQTLKCVLQGGIVQWRDRPEIGRAHV